MLESKFKREFLDLVEEAFPGCVIIKLDANDIQGIPDTLILFEDKWATLEFKRSRTASHRPNQPYYVDLLNSMSFAKFVYPENAEEILRGLQHAFSQPSRLSRFS